MAFVRQVQQNLTVQIETASEESSARHLQLTEAIDKLRVRIATAGTGQGGGAGIDPDDMLRWNDAATKVQSLEELMLRIQRELNQADLSKLK